MTRPTMPAYSVYPEVTDDGTIYVNNSSLSNFITCDCKGLLHALRLTSEEESVKLAAGTAAHEAFAVLFRTGVPADARARFAEVYQTWATERVDPNGPLAAYTYENTSYILDVWMERYVFDGLTLRIAGNGNPVLIACPSLVEIEFSWPLSDDGIIFRGRMDAIVEDAQTRKVYVLDHKTTGQVTAWWLEKFRLDSQLSGYVWAAQHHVQTTVIGAMINAVQFGKLPEDLERKCGTHKVRYAECLTMHVRAEIMPVQRTAEAVEEWKRTAVREARSYRQLILAYGRVEDIPLTRTQGKFHMGGCTFCFAKDFCANDRPVERVGSMFTRAELAVEEKPEAAA